MLPKKIYLNYVDEADEDKTWSEEPVSVYDCKMQNREYTDLSQIWHNTSEEPKFNEEIIIADHYDAVWFTDISIVNERFKNWESYVQDFDVKNWAYVSDLLPKGGGK